MKHWSVCLLAVALSGCASAYVAPSRGTPTASFSFEAKGEPTLGFAAYLVKRESSDHSCVIKSQIMARIVEGNPILGSNNPESIPVVSDVDVGLRVSFIPANLMGQIGCSYDVNLKPAQDKKYKVEIEWSRDGGCNVHLESSKDEAWGPVSEPVEIKRIGC